jgi:hypothetical protein
MLSFVRSKRMHTDQIGLCVGDGLTILMHLRTPALKQGIPYLVMIQVEKKRPKPNSNRETSSV